MREGGCACGAVRYRLAEEPLIVHACHCRDCQYLTGSAFVINLWIERRFVERSGAEPRFVTLKAGSGAGHDIYYCDACSTTLWSRYHAPPGDTLFVRAGTLDEPASVAPDVHIFTRTKLPWLALPEGARAFPDMYKDFAAVWPAEKLARFRAHAAEHKAASG
ncbi:MAG: GFA family protein [Deltaproteobacteria bacterium]|nr:MAG: GFA family protein [Deltaproteobacteria bacterium]